MRRSAGQVLKVNYRRPGWPLLTTQDFLPPSPQVPLCLSLTCSDITICGGPPVCWRPGLAPVSGHLFNPPVTVSVIIMRRQEVKGLTKGHPAQEWQQLDFSPAQADSKACGLFLILTALGRYTSDPFGWILNLDSYLSVTLFSGEPLWYSMLECDIGEASQLLLKFPSIIHTSSGYCSDFYFHQNGGVKKPKRK